VPAPPSAPAEPVPPQAGRLPVNVEPSRAGHGQVDEDQPWPATGDAPTAEDQPWPAADGAQRPRPRRRTGTVLAPVGALVAVVAVATGVWLALGGDDDVTTSFSTHPPGTAATSAPADAQLQAAPRTTAVTSSPARPSTPPAPVSPSAPAGPARSEQPRTFGDPYAGRSNPPSVAGMRLLGPPDYGGYCSSRDAGLAAVSGDQWRCTGSGQNEAFTIQVTDACRWTYRSRQVVAAAYDTADPYSWRCYSRR